MRFNHLPTIGIFAALLWGNLAQAALHDRGNGLIYDDILGVTWLQDANLAASETFGVSGIRDDGSFESCRDVGPWLHAMRNAHYKGYNDWRLPKNSFPVNGHTYQNDLSYDGSTDNAYNIGVPGSAYPDSKAYPLAHLFYRSLGNQGWYDLNGDRNVQGCPDDTNGCLRNTGPFINMQPGIYIDSDEFCDAIIGVPPPLFMLTFDFRTGQQSFFSTAMVPPLPPKPFVLPYRFGDVKGFRHVPTLSPWLLGAMAGLLLVLGGYRLRRRSSR
ncbi:IPTL-CTERM sorting domain-containing protein [Thiolapillus sp.]